MGVFRIPDPDEYLSASDFREVAEKVITLLPLLVLEEAPLDPGNIWLVVIPDILDFHVVILIFIWRELAGGPVY